VIFSPVELGAWSAAIAGAVAGAMALRRRWSSDSAGVTRDRTESRFLDQLIDDASSVRQAMRERQADAAAIAQLQERNRALERELAILTMEFEAFKRLIARNFPDAREWLGTGFAELDPAR